MPDPIVFISRNRVVEGRLDQLREFMRLATPGLEAAKPRTVVFLMYLDAAGAELTIIHAFADADAADAHWEGADDRSKTAGAFIETLSFEVYGRPSDAVLDMLRAEAGRKGVPLRLDPDFAGGFLRPGRAASNAPGAS
jgi:hypothetical protein